MWRACKACANREPTIWKWFAYRKCNIASLLLWFAQDQIHANKHQLVWPNRQVQVVMFYAGPSEWRISSRYIWWRNCGFFTCYWNREKVGWSVRMVEGKRETASEHRSRFLRLFGDSSVFHCQWRGFLQCWQSCWRRPNLSIKLVNPLVNACSGVE